MAGEGPSDVVRHIILRIIVDQAGLAAEMAAAREKLKALKQAEESTNRERVKSNDAVTKALEAQNQALKDNAEAHEAAHRAQQGRGSSAAEQVRSETGAVKQNTDARKAQTVEEAKAEAIRSKAHQDELDRIQKRRQVRKDEYRQEQTFQAGLDQFLTGFAADQENADKAAKQRRDAAAAADTAEEARKQRTEDRQKARDDAAEDREVAREKRTEDREEAKDRRQRERESRSDSYTDIRDEYITEAEGHRTDRAGSEAERAAAQAQTAGVDAGAAADKARDDAHQRRVRNLREESRLGEDINRASKNGAILEQRLAEIVERRVRAREREAAAEAKRVAAAQKDRGAFSSVGRIFTDVATAVRRVSLSENPGRDAAEVSRGYDPFREERRGAAPTMPAPFRAAAAAGRANPSSLDEQLRRSETLIGRVEARLEGLGRKFDNSRFGSGFVKGLESTLGSMQGSADRAFRAVNKNVDNTEQRFSRFFSRSGRDASRGASVIETAFASGFRKLRAGVDDADRSATRFVRSIPRSAEDVVRSFERMSAKARAFATSLNAPRSAGGPTLFQDVLGQIGNIEQRLSSGLSGMTRHLFSFSTIIVSVIGALGPLSAILGAVGAAALGLASNLGALVGSFAALPGIIGAAVSGIGALIIGLKPLSGVLTAATAAQKASTTTVNAAKDATLQYNEAVLKKSEADLAHARALQDVPRAQDAVNKARRQAARDIEDYRTSLKRLKFDEEGAALGVRSAEQQARRAIFDPTASTLDRDIAVHNLQRAQNDQQDQATQAKRTREDAADAIRKGVEGADAVVAAERSLQDANDSVTSSLYAQQQAALDLKKALDVKSAGSQAAADLKKQLDALPPQTRKVAEAYLDLVKKGGPYQKFRDSLSENIFGPISGETGKFKDVLKELSDFLTPASAAIGVLAKNALDLLTNPEWKAFFKDQGTENGKIIAWLGDAALHAAHGFKNIVEIARPFTEFVVKGIAGMAKSFDGFTSSSKGREAITWFLQNTQKRMSELWPVLKNFASGLGGFFKALNQPSGGKDDFTTWFNKGLLTASANFKKLGEQAQNPQGGFQKWLCTVRPLLHDVVQFIDEAGRFFGKLFSDQRNLDEAHRLLSALTTNVLPKLADLFSGISQSGAVSGFAKAIGEIVGALNDIANNGGISAIQTVANAVVLLAAGWEKVFGFIDRLGKQIPILGAAFKFLGNTIGLIFGAALIAKFSGLTKLISLVLKGISGANSFREFRNNRKGGGSGSGAGGLPGADVPDGVLAKLGEANEWLRKIYDVLKRGGRGTGRTDRPGETPEDHNRPRPLPAGGGTEQPALPGGSQTRQLPGSNRPRSLPPGEDPTPRPMPGGSTGDARPMPGRPRPELPAGSSPQDAQGRDARGRFTPGAATQGRDARGRFVSTDPDASAEDRRTRTTTPRRRGPGGRFLSTRLPVLFNRPDTHPNAEHREPTVLSGEVLPAENAARRELPPGSPARPTVIDGDVVEPRPSEPRPSEPRPKPSLFSRIKNRIKQIHTDDTGLSPQLARDTDGQEYEQGYEKGYADASGRGSGPDRDSRRGRRDRRRPGPGRRGRTTAVDEVEDVLDGEGSGRQPGRLSRLFRRGGGARGVAGAAEEGIEDIVEGGGGKRGLLSRLFRRGAGAASAVEEGVEDLGKGGKRGLLGRLGGGVGKGLGAGLAGAAISGALEVGGDALADKFVKNDKDRGSVKRAVGAISNGASIGSTIGGFLGPEGALIGGAIGGVAGGIYSLFKDKNLRDFVEKKLAVVGHIIADGFKSALSGIGRFFTFLKNGWADAFKIVGHFFADLGKSIGHFFASIGKWAFGIAKDIVVAFGEFLKFWYVTLPLTVAKFLLVTLPGYVARAALWLLEKFGEFLKFWYVTIPTAVARFLLTTLPGYVARAVRGALDEFGKIGHFFFTVLPKAIWDFATRTIPNAAVKAYQFFKSNLVDPLVNFFTKTIPDFFTKTIPDSIGKIGGFLKDNLVRPFADFFHALGKHDFGYWFIHPTEIAQAFAQAVTQKHQSGGLVKGIYQGVEDKALSWVTPGEMVIRRSKVEEPGAKMFLQDFNERGMESLYRGLSASAAPQVMSMVPPTAASMTGAVPTVVNNTVNHAPIMGDVTINNPVRERSDVSLRRQVQIAAIRHRR